MQKPWVSVGSPETVSKPEPKALASGLPGAATTEASAYGSIIDGFEALKRVPAKWRYRAIERWEILASLGEACQQDASSLVDTLAAQLPLFVHAG
jgi:hypothetical protein